MFMKELINKYRNLNFKERTVFNSGISVIFNAILAIGKMILAPFYGVFFFVAGVLNVFIMISKLECFLGVKMPNKRSFKFRNNMIGIFLILAGCQYAIYMGRMIFTDVELMKYNAVLAILIAFVSFVELGIAIYGCFKSYGKGHYYRNIKLINMCSAFTAIVLTEVALMSFASETDSRMLDGMFGLLVGFIIVIVGVFILIAPKISLVDREHNVYKLNGIDGFQNEEIEIKLTNSRFYGDLIYKANKKDGIIDGHILKGKSPIFKWNIYFLILVCILSEILIFPYAIGALVFYFKGAKTIDKLDKYMMEKGYIKISE